MPDLYAIFAQFPHVICVLDRLMHAEKIPAIDENAVKIIEDLGIALLQSAQMRAETAKIEVKILRKTS